LELNLGQSERVKLLKSPILGSSQYGDYFLYPVEVNGEERSFFATPEIHNQISEMKLGPGDTIILRKLAQQNGKRVNAKLMLEIVSKEPKDETSAPPYPAADQLKELLLTCIRDAVEIAKEGGVQFSNDELQKLATTLFIQRTRLAQ
jgi:hypothetical protein